MAKLLPLYPAKPGKQLEVWFGQGKGTFAHSSTIGADPMLVQGFQVEEEK